MSAQNEKITPRSQDFAQWYQDVIAAAELAEHSGVKGSMVIKPYGYALWENIQKILDEKIKATGHQNAYFPLLIPENYLTKEKEHVEGFSPELAVVTHAGGEKLEEPLVIRPTSETVIYATYSRWIQSWRDLPLLINQWANVVRWELRPRLFLRTTEFLWQEGHTAHATEAEAEEETLKMLGVYKDFAENYLATPVIDGQKSDSERFAGALRTYSVEAMMQDGKALQAGTSHNLGQNFAHVFDVGFTDKDGQRKFVWQTSWGVSTRLIGAIILTHSDDDGLVLPPKIAPIHTVIVPIWKTDEEKELVMSAAEMLSQALKETGIVVKLDDRDNLSAGAKFHEWEKKGVPVRLELGPRDIEQQNVVVVRRDTKEKKIVSQGEIVAAVSGLLNEIQESLFGRAKAYREERSIETVDYSEFKDGIEQGKFVFSGWCGERSCEEKVNQETKATIRCIPFNQRTQFDTCLACGNASKYQVVFAKAY